MKKIKKSFLYLFGIFLSFIFSQDYIFAQFNKAVYGVDTPSVKESTFWEKILSVILSPVFIIGVIVVLFLALIIGSIIFIKRKNKKQKSQNNIISNQDNNEKN